MSNNDGTALQANFKTSAGSLFNVYGPDATTFEFNLQAFGSLIPDLLKVEAALAGKVTLAPAQAPAEAIIAGTLGGQVIAQAPVAQAPVAQAPVGGAPVCRHGQMQHVDPANKPWSGYFCPQPKDATDKCAPIFDKK